MVVVCNCQCHKQTRKSVQDNPSEVYDFAHSIILVGIFLVLQTFDRLGECPHLNSKQPKCLIKTCLRYTSERTRYAK